MYFVAVFCNPLHPNACKEKVCSKGEHFIVTNNPASSGPTAPEAHGQLEAGVSIKMT